MALPPGTNVITINEDVIVATLANLTQFQSWTGTANATEAAERIIVEIDSEFSDDEKLLSEQPYCLISSPDDTPQATWTAYSKDIPYGFQCDTAVVLRFVQKTPQDWRRSKQVRIREYKNAVGDVMEAFIGEAGNAGKFGSTVVFSLPVMFTREDNKQLPWIMWDWIVQRQQEASD